MVTTGSRRDLSKCGAVPPALGIGYLWVAAAEKGVLNPDIAVYELHRIHRHSGEIM